MIEQPIFGWRLVGKEVQRLPHAGLYLASRPEPALVTDAQRGETKAGSSDTGLCSRAAAVGIGAVADESGDAGEI